MGGDISAIYAARVSATGALLDAHPVLLANECREARSAIATDGTDFVVLWNGCSQAGAHLFTAEGTVTPSFTFPKSVRFSNHAGIAFDGESYIVVWPDLSRLLIARIQRDGSAVLPAKTRIVGWGASIAARPGGGSLLVYVDDLNRLISQPLDKDGALDGEPEVVSRVTIDTSSLISRDDHFLLTGRKAGEPLLMRLDARGKPSLRQSYGVPIASASAKVFCETDCVLVWREGDSSTLGRIVAAPIRELPNGVELEEPVEVGTHDAMFRIGQPVLLRGPANDPELLLYTAPDPDGGSMQIFARSAAAKRRSSRP